MPLSNGQILQSRYRVLGPLGQGGMGAVYLAEDLRLGSRCALKEQTPDPNASPQALSQARQQFQTEARVLAQLSYPSLPKVSDYFSDGVSEYLVMEYVEGENLADLLARYGGPLPEQMVLPWAEQVLAALEYLHGLLPNPIIHRDIKPANVILTPQGTVKLVDFGLVKLLDPNSPATATAMKGMGTPEYAPLEQYAGAGHTDARSDVFSLGAMLYHLLTGSAPADVHQRSLAATALIPPRKLNSALSAGVEAALMKAIELQPDRRWQTARELRNALAGNSAPAAAVRRTVPLAWAAAIVTLTLVAVATVVGVAWTKSRERAAAVLLPTSTVHAMSIVSTFTPTSPASPTPAMTSALTVPPTPTITLTSTPDVPSVGLAWVNTTDELFLWDPAVREARSADKLAGSSQWEWAPDGRHIAYQRTDGDLYIGTLPGEKWRIATSGDFDWSPDGRQLAYLDRGGDRCVLHLVNADGSDDRILADLSGPMTWDMRGGGGPEYDMVELFISNKRPFEPSGDNVLWWMSDGQQIAVEQGFDGACQASLVRLSGDISPCEDGQCRAVTVMPASRPEDSLSTFLQDEDEALWRYGYRGANIDYTSSTARDSALVLDAAARSRLPNWGFHNNFWRRDAAGSSHRVTESESFKWLGAWSSDRSWLVFVDLVVTEGQVADECFSARRAVNLWILAPERGRVFQLTDGGDVETFAWQPALPLSGAPASASSAGMSRPAPYGIYPASSLSPALDGRFDEWSGSWQPLLAVVYGEEQRNDTADLDARFRVAWDRMGLYLALQVTDEAYRPGPSDVKMWQGDGVDINFDRDLHGDFDDARSSDDDYQIGLSFGTAVKELHGYRWLPAGRDGLLSVTGKAIATNRGYDVEALFPWDVFDVTADQVMEGATFGFNLAVNDNDGSEPAQQTVLSTSVARTTYDSPVQWGTLILASVPVVAPTVAPTASPTMAAPTAVPSPIWLSIPAGDFVMGSSDAEMQITLSECNATEGQKTGQPCQRGWFNEPQRSAHVNRFAITKHEITNAQYKACVVAGVCAQAGRVISDTNIRYDPEYFADSYPVMAVNWHDAVAYCEWIGGRLPTEVEWEYAARGVDGRRYPWGNAFEPSRANLDTSFPAPVGSYPAGASPFNVLDMAGNVFEWTATQANGNYVVRGGGWTKYYFRGRVADCGTQLSSTFANYDIGFRCAR